MFGKVGSYLGSRVKGGFNNVYNNLTLQNVLKAGVLGTALLTAAKGLKSYNHNYVQPALHSEVVPHGAVPGTAFSPEGPMPPPLTRTGNMGRAMMR